MSRFSRVLLAALAISVLGQADCSQLLPPVYPVELDSSRGSTTGDLSLLRSLEGQNGSAIQLVPAGDGYLGIFIFTVPEGDDFSGGVAVANLRGPSTQELRWRFDLFDFDARSWTAIGDNGAAVAGQWSQLELALPGALAPYVDDARELWFRVRSDPTSTPASHAMRVDYLALANATGAPIEPPPPPPPPSGDGQPVRNYAVLGNGWSAASAPADELAFAVEHFDIVQDFRSDSGEALVAAGLGTVLKYRLGVGGWPGTQNTLTRQIHDRIRGQASGFPTDIRMRKAGGGVMIHDRFGFHLVDVVTPAHRPIFQRILRESLEPLLDGPDGFSGVLLDVAGPHVPASFDGQTPAPPGGYSRAAELEGWTQVYAGLKADFPDKRIFLNFHSPWEEREPLDFTGLGLARSTGLGLMTESRMMTFGNISGWADETILDARAMVDEDLPVVVTHSFDRGSTSLVQQRHWGLATYLLAAGDSPLAAYGLDGVVDDAHLPDLPEMRFPGLGPAVGGLRSLAGGRILEQRFEGGRVAAHVKVGFAAASYDVPAGMEQLVLSGGGGYPSGGSLQWESIAPGIRTLAAPADPMPSGTALILRNTP